VTTLGTIYSSSLFPGRCPKGEMLILNYIGGASNRGVAQVRACACGRGQQQSVGAWARRSCSALLVTAWS
jgi:hypothetical protein